MNPLSLGDINDEVVKREIVEEAFDIEVKEGEDEKMVSYESNVFCLAASVTSRAS